MVQPDLEESRIWRRKKRERVCVGQWGGEGGVGKKKADWASAPRCIQI